MEKKLSLIILILFLSTTVFSQGLFKKKIKNQKDSISYFIGAEIGTNLVKQGIEINPKIMYVGFLHAFKDEEMLLTEEEKQKVVQSFKCYCSAKTIGTTKKESGDASSEHRTGKKGKCRFS